MTKRVQVLNWVVEVDPTETVRLHSARPTGDAERCGCADCRNYVVNRSALHPPEWIDLLRQLGIPVDRESEVYRYAKGSDGLHSYGGSFHFMGRILEGPEHAVGVIQFDEFARVSERLRCFLVDAECAPPWDFGDREFDEGEVVEIQLLIQIPWILDAAEPT